MALLALHALALLFLEDDDFFAALVFEDLGSDGCPLDKGRANTEGFAFANRQHVVDLDRVTGFCLGITVYDQDIAFAHCELLSLRFDDGFHVKIKGRNKKPGANRSKVYLTK